MPPVRSMGGGSSDGLSAQKGAGSGCEPSADTSQDTTRPLKQGSLALSSEISSFTTLQERGWGGAVRVSFLEEGREMHTSSQLQLSGLHPKLGIKLPTQTCSNESRGGMTQGQLFVTIRKTSAMSRSAAFLGHPLDH